MFALRKSMSTGALILALILASATPAVARPGVWIYLHENVNWTISLVNLTDHKLLISQNNFDLWCSLFCETYQSHPFEGNEPLNLEPYRTATWRSQSRDEKGPWAWSGHLDVHPEGMDAWAVSINTHTQTANNPFLHPNPGKGTWVYLSVSGTNWGSRPLEIYFPPAVSWYLPGWNYGLWTTWVPAGAIDGDHMHNVMTISGTQLAVSLYSPNNRNVTVVFRKTFWDGAKMDDYLGWPLQFVSNSSDSVP